MARRYMGKYLRLIMCPPINVVVRSGRLSQLMLQGSDVALS